MVECCRKGYANLVKLCANQNYTSSANHGFSVACEYGYLDVISVLIDRYHVDHLDMKSLLKHAIRERCDISDILDKPQVLHIEHGVLQACQNKQWHVIEYLIVKIPPDKQIEQGYREIIDTHYKGYTKIVVNSLEEYLYKDLNNIVMRYILPSPLPF